MKLYPSISIYIGIWILSILIIAYFSFSFFPRTDLFAHNFLNNLANWDGGHYLGIAEHGYSKNQYVFFPLYPVLINLLSRISGNFLSSGLTISFFSIFLSANLMYKLVSIDLGKDKALKSLIALLIFPLSFHFLTVYTESLFLLLSVATFFFARNKEYFSATICAGLASATRLSGLATVLALILPIYLTEGINKKNWIVIFAPFGFIAYCIYLYSATGDPFYFIKAESAFWNGGLVIPGSALLFSLKQLLTPGFITNNFRVLLDFLFVLLGMFGVWQVYKKLSLDYAIFSFVSFILPMFSPTIVAMPRYILTIFPIFIALSFYKNQYLVFFYQTISLMLLSLYIFLFLNGYWVS